ncbi:MAG: FAD:protein FMN transferase [Myxococcaceae bacterium]|nr:FAD:protein FMN transferase [Myxococcaceae bacterium]
MKKPFSLRQASTRWWVLLFALAAFAAARYFGSREVAAPARLEGRTMGTTWSVLLDGPRADGRLAELQRGIERLLVEINASMSTYDPSSELSRFNAHEASAAFEVSPPLARVMRDALEVHRASGGTFDVTVGPLVEVWGFGARGVRGRVPDAGQIEELLAAVGSHRLSLDGGALAKAHPRLRVDLSAIAKGDAVDRVSDLLLQSGEPNHLVEIGGELVARGVNVHGEPFRVGVEEPDPSRRSVRLAVALRDRAIASSGNFRNVFEVDGVRYAHTIDPRTGWPVQHRLAEVSVLHARCALADAWATALMAAGPDRAWALALAQGLDVLLLEEAPDGGFTERVTEGFARVLLRPGGQGAAR